MRWMRPEKADIIIMTGGLGPTKDDVTKHTLCEYFDDHLVKNEMFWSTLRTSLRNMLPPQSVT